MSHSPMTTATAFAIASESPYTVQAGRQLAQMGGNAVDIAVGSALAATVSEALMCSLGGSAFIAIKIPGEEPELIDGADAMPRIPQQDLQSEQKAWKQASIPYGDGITVNVGHASIAVPGMLRALELYTRAYGMAPASAIAPITYFGVVLGGLWGWLFWDQIPDRWSLLGSALVIVGGLLTIYLARGTTQANELSSL